MVTCVSASGETFQPFAASGELLLLSSLSVIGMIITLIR
jgi:hypothetical protein